MSGIDFELVSVEDVRQMMAATETAPVFHKREDPFKALRRRNEVEPLQGYAQSWLNTLPHQFRPVLCAKKYPRIINKLAALWQNLEQTEAYMFSLLVDTRGTRQGFPKGISEELRLVRAYLYEYYKVAETNPWGADGTRERLSASA